MKKILSIFIATIMLFCLWIPSFAVAPNDTINPKGAYLRSLVDYEPEQLSYNYTYKIMGQVSGDNTNGSSPLTITVTCSTSETITASFGISTLVSAQKDLVVAKVSAQASFDVATSRSWTRGDSCGATYNVPAGKCQRITAYMPSVSTSGSLKYKVHIDGYSNYWYASVTLPTTYLPAKNSVHFVVNNM